MESLAFELRCPCVAEAGGRFGGRLAEDQHEPTFLTNFRAYLAPLPAGTTALAGEQQLPQTTTRMAEVGGRFGGRNAEAKSFINARAT